MQRIREEDARTQFTTAITLSEAQVRTAKDYFAEAVSDPVDGTTLIGQWWRRRKTPPVEHLILDEDYGFTDACIRAARYWESRLCAAEALRELVNEGYLDRVGSVVHVEGVHQGYTTVTPESGSGTTGGWSLDRFNIEYPARVTKGPFAKTWTALPADSELASIPAIPTVLQPLGAIASPKISGDAIEALNELERQLIVLVESGDLSRESKTLITEQAYILIDELRTILREVATNEHARAGLIRRAATTTGKVLGTLASAGRLVAGVQGLANSPAVFEEGEKILHSIEHWIG